MSVYIKHRKTLQSKTRKKEVIPPVTTVSVVTHTPTPTPDLESESVRLVEEKISQKVVSLFDTLLGNLDEVVANKIKASLSAPLLVPEPAPGGGAGGDGSRQWVNRASDCQTLQCGASL